MFGSSSSSSSDCGHHRRSQACALCIIFSILFTVSPAFTSKLNQQETEGPPGGRTTSSYHQGDLTGGTNEQLTEQLGEEHDGGGGWYRHVPPGVLKGSVEQLKTTHVFLKKIFDKYGQDGIMTFEGFQKLLKNLDIGAKAAVTGEQQAVGDSATRHVPPAHHRDHHTSDYDDYEYHDRDGTGDHDGHDHDGHDHDGHDHDRHNHDGHDHAGHDHAEQDHDGHDHAEHDHDGHDHDRHDGHAHSETEPHGNEGEGQAHLEPRGGGQDIQRDHYRVQKQPTRDDILTDSPVQKHHDYRLPERDQSTVSFPYKTDPPTESSSADDAFLEAPLKRPTEVKTSPSPILKPHNISQSDDAVSRPSRHIRSDPHSNYKTRRLSSVKPIHNHTEASATKDIPGAGTHRIESMPGSNVRHPIRHRPQGLNMQSRGQRRPRPSSHTDVLDRVRRETKVTETHSDDDHRKLPLDRHEQCLSTSFLLKLHNVDLKQPITNTDFLLLCPAIIQQLDSQACAATLLPLGLASDGSTENGLEHDHDHEKHDHSNHSAGARKTYHVSQISGEVWGYAFLSVLIISLVGLLSVAVVPIMQKVFYNHLLQFLVALAVGTLLGDAFLHLIPHALGAHGDEPEHDHSEGDAHAGTSSHMQGVWRGMVALSGVYFFFLMERIMGIVTTWRRKADLKKVHNNSHNSPKMYRTVEEHESDVGAKLSKHSDVVTSCEEIVMVVHPGKDVRNLAEDMHDELHRDCEPEEREQLNHSHGAHGHSHGAPPTGIAAVAWMVIMGDGFHNFTDGLAIGAAFASGLSGGVSTSVAVFCHELPHEIGDFAVLLRAGMTVKQAIAYNFVSSILCVFGMIVGVCVGNIGNISLWVLALAGGMFIYIALVDMLPELTAMQPRKGENPLFHLALQNLGMLLGAGIMAVIAIYEDRIILPHFEP